MLWRPCYSPKWLSFRVWREYMYRLIARWPHLENWPHIFISLLKIDALKGNSQATCRSGVKRKHVETTSKMSRTGGSATRLHFSLLSIMFLSYLKCFKYEFLNVQFKIFVRNKVTVTTTWMRTVKEVNFIQCVLDVFS